MSVEESDESILSDHSSHVDEYAPRRKKSKKGGMKKAMKKKVSTQKSVVDDANQCLELLNESILKIETSCNRNFVKVENRINYLVEIVETKWEEKTKPIVQEKKEHISRYAYFFKVQNYVNEEINLNNLKQTKWRHLLYGTKKTKTDEVYGWLYFCNHRKFPMQKLDNQNWSWEMSKLTPIQSLEKVRIETYPLFLVGNF